MPAGQTAIWYISCNRRKLSNRKNKKDTELPYEKRFFSMISLYFTWTEAVTNLQNSGPTNPLVARIYSIDT